MHNLDPFITRKMGIELCVNVPRSRYIITTGYSTVAYSGIMQRPIASEHTRAVVMPTSGCTSVIGCVFYHKTNIFQ